MNNDNANRFQETIVGRFARHLHDTEVFTNEFTRDMSDEEFEQFLCREYDEWTNDHPWLDQPSAEKASRMAKAATKACAEVWCPVQYKIRRGMWVRR